MPLSLPIHRLKRAARQKARDSSLPLHAALDLVAGTEGYPSWSLLAARHAASADPQRLHASLDPGDMVLIAARPRQGKTVLAIEMALAAIAAGNPGYIFSLDDRPSDVANRLSAIGAKLAAHGKNLAIDCSDTISADHIVTRLAGAPSGTLAVIDYLQLLDQKRANPPLQHQVEALARFARERGTIFVFICQIDRAYDPACSALPDRADIRLPNPLDLALFNRTWFLHDGQLRLADQA